VNILVYIHDYYAKVMSMVVVVIGAMDDGRERRDVRLGARARRQRRNRRSGGARRMDLASPSPSSSSPPPSSMRMGLVLHQFPSTPSVSVLVR